MNKTELYEKYLKEKWVRKISKYVFFTYLDKYGGYEETISFLNKPKWYHHNKKWAFKAKNIQEILDYVKLFSVEKAAKEYDISERTIYRYINLNSKK